MDQASFTDDALKEAEFDAVMTAPESAANDGSVEIETRYGPVTFDLSTALAMTRAMPGFPGLTAFGLANLPDARFEQFKLLQSLEAPEVSFLVTPVPVDNPLLALEDAEKMLSELGIEKENAALLLVVTVRKDPDQSVALTVNARAPVVLDTERRQASQYVMRSEAYDIQHPIQLQ